MITILLATYNGEKYLSEQINSLLNQSFKDFKILVRDDGSTDGTLDVLNRFINDYPQKITLLNDRTPTGSSARNFFRLLSAVDDDYVMFCDQDDFWLPQKIEKTFEKMKMLEKEHGDIPLLVHSDLSVVDAELNLINKSFFDFQKISPERDRLNNLLVQNNVTGCTAMINRKMLMLAKDEPISCAMHDWWIALLAAAFGKADFISEPLILYRQHGGNRVGAKNASGMEFIKRKIKDRKKTAKNYNDAYLQASELLRIHGEKMSESDRETVAAFASLKTSSKIKKIKLINKYDFKKNTFIRNIGQYISI